MEDISNWDLRNLKFVDYFLSEKKIVESLSISKEENRINFNLFSNLIFHPIEEKEYLNYDGFYLGFEVLREKLGFDKTDKPGDFDILIIPFSTGRVYFERTCAIEVKIVRPTRNNPKKAPNSYGIQQVNGLIKDGFPLVGLIHICMTEPLKEEEKSIIKYAPIPLDNDNPSNNDDFFFVDVKVDTFSQFSAKNQMKRLISKDLPKYVGLHTVGLNISKDNKFITWYDDLFNKRFEGGYFNPHTKKATIESIKKYFEENKQDLKEVKN